MNLRVIRGGRVPDDDPTIDREIAEREQDADRAAALDQMADDAIAELDARRDVVDVPGEPDPRSLSDLVDALPPAADATRGSGE